jgi:hypothetical protein
MKASQPAADVELSIHRFHFLTKAASAIAGQTLVLSAFGLRWD